MKFNKTTEAESKYQDLDKMELNEILKNINKEDILVPVAVEKAIPQIEKLTEQIVLKLKKGESRDPFSGLNPVFPGESRRGAPGGRANVVNS